jgi:hypothetical protein
MYRLLLVTVPCGLGHSYSIFERPKLSHSIAKIGRHFLKEAGSYVALFHGAPHATPPSPINLFFLLVAVCRPSDIS